jgi:hypothetical protein
VQCRIGRIRGGIGARRRRGGNEGGEGYCNGEEGSEQKMEEEGRWNERAVKVSSTKLYDISPYFLTISADAESGQYSGGAGRGRQSKPHLLEDRRPCSCPLQQGKGDEYRSRFQRGRGKLTALVITSLQASILGVEPYGEDRQ